MRAAVWAVVGGLTLASYFYQYHQPTGPSMLSNFSSVAALVRLVVYFLTYVGAPVGAYRGVVAALSGVGITMVFASLAVRLRGRWREPAILFPVLVGLLVIGVAAISGTGRAWLGANQALSSRYGTIGLHLWCAAAVLGVESMRAQAGAARRSMWQPVTRVVAIAVVASAIYNGVAAGRLAAARSDSLRIARRGLITGRSDALLRLYPDLATIQQRRVILQTLGTSVFRHTR